MQSNTEVNVAKVKMDKELFVLRAKSIFFKVLKYTALILAAIVFIIPILTTFLASFKEYNEFYSTN